MVRTREARRHNLPASLTTFVGREPAVAEALRLLDGSRLLTLVGSGGIGKTRMALRIASDVVDVYPDGAWLVELAPVADPFLVVAAARGDHSTARKRLEERLELGRTLGISRGVVWSLYFLAQHALAQGDARRARATFPESLRLARQTGDHLATAFCIEGFAGALAVTQPGRAVRLAEAAGSLREALGSTLFPADRERLDRWLDVAARGLCDTATSVARGEARAMTLDQAVAYALAGDEPATGADAPRHLAGRSFAGLTRREVEVLRLVALAQSNREIAASLVLQRKDG